MRIKIVEYQDFNGVVILINTVANQLKIFTRLSLLFIRPCTYKQYKIFPPTLSIQTTLIILERYTKFIKVTPTPPMHIRLYKNHSVVFLGFLLLFFLGGGLLFFLLVLQ
jgi:hypothetical protein